MRASAAGPCSGRRSGRTSRWPRSSGWSCRSTTGTRTTTSSRSWPPTAHRSGRSSTASPATRRWPRYCVERGWYLSFAGPVTFASARDLRAALHVDPAGPGAARDGRALPDAAPVPRAAERPGDGRRDRPGGRRPSSTSTSAGSARQCRRRARPCTARGEPSPFTRVGPGPPDYPRSCPFRYRHEGSPVAGSVTVPTRDTGATCHCAAPRRTSAASDVGWPRRRLCSRSSSPGTTAFATLHKTVTLDVDGEVATVSRLRPHGR